MRSCKSVLFKFSQSLHCEFGVHFSAPNLINRLLIAFAFNQEAIEDLEIQENGHLRYCVELNEADARA